MLNFIGTKICNGVSTPRKMYTEVHQQVIREHLPLIRKKLLVQYGYKSDRLELKAGHRFNSDIAVIDRMESAEQNNGLTLDEFIEDALIDCMQTDYYMWDTKDL